jgi:NAD(P)-dependent dehydrogenase (short-subunit alcohol dehydrogenase family)
MSSRIIISASSDIGAALARSWMDQGHDVMGTYRTRSTELVDLVDSGMSAVKCDLLDKPSIDSTCEELSKAGSWNVLVLGPGLQDPVGPFSEVSFDEWEASVLVNFTAQMGIVRRLLGSRDVDTPNSPCVLFFAGGGTNNATVNYSAYTISKIALIKMTELLDAEMPDTKFTIIGPGWVESKIHDSTLNAGADLAGANYQKTVDMLAGDDLVPMQAVIDCCDWVIGSERSVVGGRNISLVYDGWGDPELDGILRSDNDMYKLRRSGNDRMVRHRLPYS